MAQMTPEQQLRFAFVQNNPTDKSIEEIDKLVSYVLHGRLGGILPVGSIVEIKKQ